MTRSVVLGLVLSLAGCAFTEIPPPPGSVAVNKCEEDAECSGGKCRGSICVETSTSITTLITEVTPPTTASHMGGLPFYTRLESPHGNIAIGAVGTVTTTIDASVEADCLFEGPSPARDPLVPSDGTIPADLSFVPSERVLGVATPTYVASTGPGGDGWTFGEDRYLSQTSLPPGDYDIYVEPRPTGDATRCKVPPLLVRRKAIAGKLALAIELPPPSILELTVRAPVGDQSLSGWSVAVLDSVSGRVLSADAMLSAPTAAAASTEYSVTVPFVPAHIVIDDGLRPDPEFEGHEIIRLSPPKGAIAPSFLFDRAGVDLTPGPEIIDVTPNGGIVGSTSAIPLNVVIEGQTASFATRLPAEAAVTLAATKIEGAIDQASFITTIQVDETGKFTAEVPPGSYRVRAVPPPALGLAAAETTWQVRAGLPLQAGKLIELPPAPEVTGEAFVNGGPAFGATASSVVSPLSAQTTVLERELGTPPVQPRTSAALVANDGSFAFDVDPGTYDFFVRPEARSNYAWLVLPSLAVPTDGLNLGKRRLTLPFVYSGSVVVEGTPANIPGALVRAYVYVTSLGEYTPDAAKSAAVIPVAETRTDENGRFQLLIPASLDAL